MSGSLRERVADEDLLPQYRLWSCTRPPRVPPSARSERRLRCGDRFERTIAIRRRGHRAAWQGKQLLRAVYAAPRLGRGSGHAGAVLPLVRRHRGGRAVAAGPHGGRLGGRDPGLAPDRWLLHRPHRGDQPAHQAGQAGRPRLSLLRQLPAAPAVALRRQVADARDRETAKPLTTFGGVEPAIHVERQDPGLRASTCGRRRWASTWCSSGSVRC